MVAAFWISVALIVYGYLGYPLLAAFVGLLRHRPVRSGPVTPRLSVLVAAYNEEDSIGERIENVLASDYPPDRLEVVVASDGSEDDTEAIVAALESERVPLLALPRGGKARALNTAAREARGEILVFTDANTAFEPDALRKLVRSFADPDVGGVVGHTLYRRPSENGSSVPERPSDGSHGGRPSSRGRRAGKDPSDASGRGERVYWRYDTWLKKLESRTGSVVSAHGGMYGVRAELFRPIEDPSVTDDFAVSTAVVEQGRRLVFEADARAFEGTVGSTGGEFWRRVRLMTRGLRGVLLRRRLLDPFDHGFYAVSLFSRKVLRRLLPLSLPVLLASSLALWGEGTVYSASAAGQLAFYGLALAGWPLRRAPLGRFKLFYVPFFYCLANLASLFALVNLARGKRIDRWSPQRHGRVAPASRSSEEKGRSPPWIGGPSSAGKRSDRRSPAREPHPAVVIGVDCVTGLQTSRILHARGIEVIGLARERWHPCALTRTCSQVIETDTSGPDLLGTLRELAAHRVGRAVLFPCTDLSVLRLARHRQDLPESLRIVLPEAEVIETLLDKARFQEMAERYGFPVPQSRLLRSPDDVRKAARDLRFPCALKPPVKTEEWSRATPAKVFKAESPEDLVQLYDRYSRRMDEMVVQEWVDGPDTRHFTCNCYIGRDGEPLVAFTTKKLRQWPLDGGQGCLSEEDRNDAVRDETLRLFREAGHRGLGYLEMKWDEATGRHVILEANVGRPTGRSATAEAAGVELLLTVYRDALGLPLPGEREQRSGGTKKWIHLRRDLEASVTLGLRGQLGFREWARSVRGARVHALFSLRDPVPFMADVARASWKLPGRGLRWLERSTPEAGSKVAPEEFPPAIDSKDLARVGPPQDVARFRVGEAVTVELEAPSASDLAAAERLLGACGPALAGDGEPDIRIRYRERLPAPALRLVQEGRSGYTDDGFFLLDPPTSRPIARLDLVDGGARCELTALRGIGRLSLLQTLVDLMALKRGWAALHASGWIHRNTGVLAAGWDRSGKTGTLLAFGHMGAAFVGDDRIFLRRDGARMSGIRRPVTVRPWHLAYHPGLRRRLGRRVGWVRRSLANVGPWLQGAQLRLLRIGVVHRLVPRVMAKLRARLSSDLAPEDVFGRDRVPLAAVPGVVFLLLAHDDDSIRVAPADPGDTARRLAASVVAELRPLRELYEALRFAFPGTRWSLLEEAEELAGEILGEALEDRRVFTVSHPYPCSLGEIYQAMDAVLPGTCREASGSRPSEATAPDLRGLRPLGVPEAAATARPPATG